MRALQISLFFTVIFSSFSAYASFKHYRGETLMGKPCSMSIIKYNGMKFLKSSFTQNNVFKVVQEEDSFMIAENKGMLPLVLMVALDETSKYAMPFKVSVWDADAQRSLIRCLF